jgi:Fic family protein
VVHISGTDYVPPVPEKESVLSGLNEILNSKATVTERALRLFCLLARSQLFWDGNKRTATLAANWLMIQHGAGLLQIKEKCLSEFNLALKKFYDTGESEELIYLLYENCVVGMTV